MRRPTDAEAHRGRAALIEGRYPEDMEGRCALCGKVKRIADGKMVEGDRPTVGAMRSFVCSDCLEASGGRAA